MKRKDMQLITKTRYMRQDEFREKQRRQMEKLRMVKDVAMALFMLVVAGLLFFAKKLNLAIELDDTLRKILAGLFTLYGSFRLYRGLKKDY